MKGQQPFVSHTMVIGFASVLIVIVAASLVTVHSDYSDFIIGSSSNDVCFELRAVTASIVSNGLTKGQIILHLSDKIGDKNYDLSADYNSVKIQWENKEKVCNLGYNVNMTGRVEGGTVLLDFENFDTVNIVLGGI